MKRLVVMFLLVPLLLADNAAPKMQIALLLDTSNSMDGLINQAKSKLWVVVNEMATARRNGQIPELEVALYEYGNNGLSMESGYVRCLSPLTRDLDLISEKLFALQTNGGEEYCAWVIDTAMQLNWSADTGTYKAIFIAGNEPFNQGPKAFEPICKAAISRGIVVNTIFCGNRSEGEMTGWKKGAELADGSFFCLDQDQAVAAIQTPVDQKILDLNQRLNATYVAYGSAGKEYKQRQVAQDANATSMSSEVAVNRALSKKNAAYNNTDWDLVDAVAEGVVDVEKPESEAALPEPMRDMKPEERKAYVEKLGKERATIQKELSALEKERQAFIDKEIKKQTATLDDLVVKSVKEQAKRRGYVFNQ
ncbi:MAG: VWA domain-containing protein [Acidobacteria bacterium]|nr:VWA domain-containing protein [Acidobacteriota bacterium]MCB9397455.1 VWA domain-containing protein [Acidobacteriota bacterium]